MPTIQYRGSRSDFRNDLGRLLAALAGDGLDPSGRIDRIKERMAEVLLEKISDAYEVKMRGGTDEFGIQWPDLSPATIRRKGHATIMVEESELLASLQPGSGHPDQILRMGPGWLEVGSDRSTRSGVPLISIHARGNARLPVRRVLPPPDAELPAAWVEAMGQVLLDEFSTEEFWRTFLGSKAA